MTDTDESDRQLWCAVILQAIDDATRERLPTIPADRRNAIRERDEARTWLTGNSRDFHKICALAGMDSQWISANAAKKIEVFEVNDKTRAKLHEHDGQRKTLKQWAKQYGLTTTVLQSRIYKTGLTLAQALTYKPKKSPCLFTYNGETLNVKQWAERIDISHGTLASRLRHGMSIEQALTAPVQQGRPKGSKPVNLIRPATERHTVKGESLTLPQWAERIGISYGALMQRAKRFSLEEIIAQGRDIRIGRPPSKQPSLDHGKPDLDHKAGGGSRLQPKDREPVMGRNKRSWRNEFSAKQDLAA